MNVQLKNACLALNRSGKDDFKFFFGGKFFAGDYIPISIASATSTLPCSRCGHFLAISRASSMLSAFTMENPVRRFVPPPSVTPPELTTLGLLRGVPRLTMAAPRPPTQDFHFDIYLAPSSGLPNFGSP